LKEKFWRITSQISRQEELRASSCGSHHHATGLRSPPHRTTIPPPPGPGPLRPTEGPLDPPPRPQIGQTWRSEFIRSAPALVPKRHYRRTDRNREKNVFSEEPFGPSAWAREGDSCYGPGKGKLSNWRLGSRELSGAEAHVLLP
jgi:hypothetical protein